jgi:hypothetical protein
MEQNQPQPSAPAAHNRLEYRPPKRAWNVWDYAWFIVKNIVGWLLVIGAMPAGLALPGPGGFPLFVIGFAMVSFPGKRKLTSRVLRGKPVDRRGRIYRFFVGTVAVLAPIGPVGWLFHRTWPFFPEGTPKITLAIMAYLCAVVLIWIFGIHGVHIINLGLSFVPRLRRRVRPWLRRRGLDLLPPRRRKRLLRRGQVADPDADDQEILEFAENHHRRVRRAWSWFRPWLLNTLRLGLVLLIFWKMLEPVHRHWSGVSDRILATNWWLFAVAALMFSVFLFTFCATNWRWILIGFGHRLPVAAATRIWAMSELARYVPGAIWQVVGRVYLARPYGVGGAITSASQILEMAIMMLANVLVALTCISIAGMRQIPHEHRRWIFIAIGFLPVLVALLHPKVFYGLMNWLMAKFKRPPIPQALRKRQLALLVLWTILGLLWESLAIWILTSSVLHLPIGKWYVLAGAWCLAWTMGFSLGSVAPGGIGVREGVLVITLQFLLGPQWAAKNLPDPSLLPALAAYVAVLLRLWTLSGELFMAGLAFLADYKGACGLPGAPGRLPVVAKVSDAR